MYETNKLNFYNSIIDELLKDNLISKEEQSRALAYLMDMESSSHIEEMVA